jgi:VanZ family protein
MLSLRLFPLLSAMPALFVLLVLDPKLRKLRIGCALLMYTAILVMGSIPGARAEIGRYATGVVLHSLAYAILTFLIFTGSSGSARSRAFKSVLAVALMGAGDELLQTLFPYRGAAVADWLVDCSAAIVTSALLWALLPRSVPAR